MTKIKKITLIRPPAAAADENAITRLEVKHPPIGLAILYAILKKEGYDAAIMDAYVKEWGDVKEFLLRNSADVVGISCHTGQHLSSLKIAEMAKTFLRPEPVVIMGGPHPSVIPLDKQILENYSYVDFVVRGEAEETLIELLRTLDAGSDPDSVKGITFRRNGSIVRTEDRPPVMDLDSLPLPDYSFFDFEITRGSTDGVINRISDRGIMRNRPFAAIMSSRGCPNTCIFCSLFMGNRIRYRSAENVVAEIENLQRSRGLRHFTFADDCLNLSLPRMEKICNLILERNLDITWSALGRVTPINKDILALMKRSGCVTFSFGVESGSDSILKGIKKNITTHAIEKAFGVVKDVGISSDALLIVGSPGETDDTVNETIRFLRRVRPSGVTINPLTIYPGSEIYALAVRKRLIDQDYWLKNRVPPYYTEEHSDDELRYYRLRILFYYHAAKADIVIMLKLGVMLVAYKLIKLFGLRVNEVRDGLLKVPVIAYLMGKFKTA
mgnify:FL=1